jgi:hypothetical protein
VDLIFGKPAALVFFWGGFVFSKKKLGRGVGEGARINLLDVLEVKKGC